VAAAAPAVRLRGIVKRYPRVVANDGVDLTVEPGTIHALIGENGAGKSTLMKILYGLVRPDEGTIELDGKPVSFNGPSDAIAAGIGMVHQHFMLVPPLTVYENVVLGSEPGGFAWDRAEAIRRVSALSKEYGIAVEPMARVESLSVGEQQRVEILKVLYRGAKILILDEPTAVLTPQESDALFATLRRLRDAGSTILFISHKLKEVVALCGAATVLRRGKTVGSRPIAGAEPAELAKMMIGELKEPPAAPEAASRIQGEGLLLEKVSYAGPSASRSLNEVSLSVGFGEILGVAGVEGNGQKELAEVVCGLAKASSGFLVASSPVGHIPEDRHKEALLMGAAAWENMLLGLQRKRRFGKTWKLDRPAIAEHVRRILKDFDVRPPAPEQPAAAFSGGNQQKFVVGRELAKSPKLLVAAHPTRGVDLGASRLIHEKLLEARANGAAILLISADLDEILALSDRVAVLHAGRVMGVVPRAEATVERLGSWMAGLHDSVPAKGAGKVRA
jgi:simple sugar transport system ATP-binding protein